MVSLSTETSVLNDNKINSMFNSITFTRYRFFYDLVKKNY